MTTTATESKETEVTQLSEPAYTEAEWAIMRVVWAQEPCAAGVVRDALKSTRNWAYSTVKTTMDRMVRKGLLRVNKKNHIQLFSARFSRPEAGKAELDRWVDRIFDGNRGDALAFMLKNTSLSREELERCQKTIRTNLEGRKPQ